MTIRDRIKIGGIALALFVLLAFVVAGVGIQSIRFGGPIHHENQMLSDLTGDILPPPEYVIESYLEATQLQVHPETLDERRLHLKALKKQYFDREGFWRDANLAPEVKSILTKKSAPLVHEFWQEMDSNYLPSIAAHDNAAAARSYAKLSDIYRRHRIAIDDLVLAAGQQQTRVAQKSFVTLSIVIVLQITLAASIMAGIYWAFHRLDRMIVEPVDQIAGQLDQMSAGNFSVELCQADGNDEISALRRAALAFRDAGETREKTGQQQAQVVVALDKGLNAISGGDLAFRLESPLPGRYEELRLTFNRSLERLSILLGKVVEAATSVATGASEIRAASDDLSHRNQNQAAGVEEAAAAIREVTDLVTGTATDARAIQQSITSAHREAINGAGVVRATVEAMANIESSAQEISKIIAVIDGIAFQTNLLALNAGVEAARAGDAGKGFAVVANEVRALAQRSAEAANDIKSLISNSTQQVNNGVSLVDETGGLLENIVGQFAGIAENITQIADRSELQAGSLRQIARSVTDMDRLTQQNAAMVEEATAAARSLSNEAERLQTTAGQFHFSKPNSSDAAAGAPLDGLDALSFKRAANAF